MFDQFLMKSLKIGEQSYFFNVDVEGFDPTTENPADDDNNPDNPKVPKSKVAGLIVVLCLSLSVLSQTGAMRAAHQRYLRHLCRSPLVSICDGHAAACGK